MPREADLFPPPPEGEPKVQATYWLTLMNSGLAEPGQRAAFDAWLNADPAHLSAWDEARALWHQIDRLSAARPNRTARRGRLPVPRTWAAAAMLVLGVALGAGASPWLYADYTTATGESRTVDLADGSHIEINTHTAVDFQTGGTRHLTLHRGEIFVQVAADAEHPFEVETPAGTVRALGTAFGVRLEDEAATVTVYEHAVRVKPAHGEALEQLKEGQRVRFTRREAHAVETADLDREGAWRRQRLVFQDRPLALVVEEINRYRRLPLIVADSAIGSLPITGVFDSRDTDAALAMIQNSLGLRSLHIPGGLVVLFAG